MEPKREDSKSFGLDVESVKSNAEDSFVTIETLIQSGFSPENGALVGQNTYNIIAYIIDCEKHDIIAVNKMNSLQRHSTEQTTYSLATQTNQHNHNNHIDYSISGSFLQFINSSVYYILLCLIRLF